MDRNWVFWGTTVAYGAWGVLHVVIGTWLLATNLFGPADAFADEGIPADTSDHARALFVQNNMSLLAGAFAVTVAAVLYGRGRRGAYWVMMPVSTLFMLEFVLLEIIPGHLPVSQAIAPVGIWIVATAFGAAGRLHATDARPSSA